MTACMPDQLMAFWVGLFKKYLNPGDRIEIHSSDHLVQFEIFVPWMQPRCGPADIDIRFRAIYPPDLQLPISSTKRRHRAWFDERKNCWMVFAPDGSLAT